MLKIYTRVSEVFGCSPECAGWIEKNFGGVNSAGRQASANIVDKYEYNTQLLKNVAADTNLWGVIYGS